MRGHNISPVIIRNSLLFRALVEFSGNTHNVCEQKGLIHVPAFTDVQADASFFLFTFMLSSYFPVFATGSSFAVDFSDRMIRHETTIIFTI